MARFLRIFFLFLAFSFHAQTFMLTSGDGRFFADCKHVKSEPRRNLNHYVLHVHNIITRSPALTYSFSVSFFSELREIQLSYSGHLLYIRTSTETTVLNIALKKEIRRFPGSHLIIFPSYDNFFIFDNGTLQCMESDYGVLLHTYERSGGRTGDRNIRITPDDEYLVVQAGQAINLWKIDKAALLRKLTGNKLCFDPANDKLTLFSNTKSYTYRASDFSLLTKENLKTACREFTFGKPPGELSIRPQNYFASPGGNWVFIPYTNARSKKNDLLLVSTQRHEAVPLNFDQAIYDSCAWLNDSVIIFHYPGEASRVLLVSGVPEFKTLNYTSNKDRGSWIVNSSFSYMVQKKETIFHKQFLLKSTGQNFTLSKLDERFLLFAYGNKSMIVMKNKIKGVIYLNDPGHTFYPFSDSIIPVKEALVEDEDPPQGYKSDRILSLSDLSKKPDSVKVHLVLKNIELEDSMLSVNVHIMDDAGTYYFGAASDSLKKLWCNLLVRSGGGMFRQVTDFEITEYRKSDSMAVAMALVMDHSGSMGEPRTKALQQGALTFIRKKDRRDVLAILKYDTKIILEAPPTTDSLQLSQDLRINGFGIFGGGTSLLDAGNGGVAVLKKLNGYTNKAVILLTDGNENSSAISFKELIKRANAHNIKVHTIGYGKNVSEDYLRQLSANTQGGFYHIYKKKDFEWIFEDIHTKLKSYYQVKFKLQDYGKLSLLLKICGGINSDALRMDVTVGSINGKSVINDDADKKSKDKSSEKETGNFPDINDFRNIKTRKQETYGIKKPAAKNSDTLDIAALEEEFDHLEFPDIKFKLDETEIISGTDAGLENVALFLKKYPATRIEISGHTDSSGDPVHNLSLSAARAEVVKNMLIQEGASQNNILSKGYGITKPLVPNTSEENKLKNRRVEFSILQ